MPGESDKYPDGECEEHEASDREQDGYFEENKAPSHPQQRGPVGQYLPQCPVNHDNGGCPPHQDVDRSNLPLLPRESASQVRTLQPEDGGQSETFAEVPRQDSAQLLFKEEKEM